MEVNAYKEVYFGQFCKTCKNKDIPEDRDPCDECLEHPVNLYSHKPVNYEEDGNLVEKTTR